MTEPTSPQDRKPSTSGVAPSSPRFRLVGDTADGAAVDNAPTARWQDVPPRLMVPAAEWHERWPEAPQGMALARANVPLLGSIARIRGDRAASEALAGVLEMLNAGGGIELPCGGLDSGEIGLVVPKAIEMEYISESIDEALRAQVRATDLQGPLRERSGARVDPL